jgi:8-hydroxy-5-deazaflavin:NADPH oxidoreductase
MTTIGIIGSGHVGSNLAKAAIAHGYDVVLSNSQGTDSLDGLVKDLGPHARAGTPAEAAGAADFAIVAIPVTAIGQVPVEPLAGKLVIATINYFPGRLGHIPEGAPSSRSSFSSTARLARSNVCRPAGVSWSSEERRSPGLGTLRQ